MGTMTIGVDLAKSQFSVCAVDVAGHVQRRQDLGREAFARWCNYPVNFCSGVTVGRRHR